MKRIYFFLLVIVLYLAACTSIENPNYEEKAKEPANVNQAENALETNAEMKDNYLLAEVVHIVDGDTLTIEKNSLNLSSIQDEDLKKQLNNITDEEVKVRFLAVDTPEITGGKEQPYGQEAKQLVQQLLIDNKVILEIDPKASFDKYGRLLAHAFTSEGESIQTSLLRAGVARTAYLFDDYNHVDDYQVAESQAIANELNIYSINGYVTTDGFNMDAVDDGLAIEKMTISDMMNLLEDLPNKELSNLLQLLF